MHHIKPKILNPKGKKRNGRGFSPNELEKAGLNAVEALKAGLPVDFRRKTAHQENVDAIKAYMEKVKTEAKPKPKPKSTAKSKKKPKR